MAIVRDALDIQKVTLLKSDPDKYFSKDRRQPFGFSMSQSEPETTSSEQVQ